MHNAFGVGLNAPVAAKGAVYVASHVDVPPPRKDDPDRAVESARRGEPQGRRQPALRGRQQTSRPNHFTVVEVWKDKKAYDARGTAAAQKAFRDKLGPMLGALYDERIYKAIN